MIRRLFACLLPVILTSAELKVDHVTIAGQDLASMRLKLEAVGLHSEYGGKHSNHATEMASVSFPDGSYVELIAIQKDGDPAAIQAHYWSKQMEKNIGPCAWAVRLSDVTKEAESLRHNSVEVSSPQASGRIRSDGTQLKWKTARVGPEPQGTFFPFLIEDVTNRNLRAFPSGAPASHDFQGVSRVVIAVRDLDASTERYRRAFNLADAEEDRDAALKSRLHMFPGTPVILIAPTSADSPIAERIQQAGEGPVAFILKSTAAAPSRALSETKWFGQTISWFDGSKLGWRLGFE